MRKLLNKFFCFIFLLTFLTSCKGNNTNNSNENKSFKVTSDTDNIEVTTNKIQEIEEIRETKPKTAAYVKDIRNNGTVLTKHIDGIGADDADAWLEIKNFLSDYKLVENIDSKPPLGCLYPNLYRRKNGIHK